ncbi:hypothetical protein LCGC14_1022990 [marine sediment metagenome]|uniref:Uncharacterized protein n=1 Tax=marine sediment metagenome TaxID=412755 RepID=A0A0F9N1G8_9ZZZZ|nr:hypothetical protein [Candidatus Aminicenantes bacterium]
MIKSSEAAYFGLSLASYGKVEIGALQASGNVSAAATYTGRDANQKKITAKTKLTIDVTGTTPKVGHTLNISGTLAAAFGTVTLASAVAGDTVTVNGLVYTGVTGVKADDTEFSVDTSDTAAATDLADSIDDDVRVGTLNDLTAVGASAVVTITQTVAGPTGNATTLVSSNGTRLAVSGALFTGGVDVDGLHPIIKVIDSLNFVVDVDFSADASGTWNSMGAKGIFVGFIPATAVQAGEITSMTYHSPEVQIGDPTKDAFVAGVFYPFPGLIDELILSAADLTLLRYPTTKPQQ